MKRKAFAWVLLPLLALGTAANGQIFEDEEENGIYSDDYGMAEVGYEEDGYGYYNSEYNWETDDEGFGDWYGESDDDWLF